MNTHTEKTQENKSQSVANDSLQKSSGESIFQFVDNRPEAIAQRKLQIMANISPQAKQAAQLQAIADNYSAQRNHPIQKKENNTGLPDNLKSGIENHSGYSMGDVKVHYNSDKPAQLHAHAYAQGTDIHLASGQEKYLPHETWHVVQQKQGRVKPTMQMKGKVNINDDAVLEKEADAMGNKALGDETSHQLFKPTHTTQMVQVLQRVSFNSDIDFDNTGKLNTQGTTNPENKAGILNDMIKVQAISDLNLASKYNNGHMIAAIFGGNNKGDNIRVWSDKYEPIHSDLEKQIRYGNGSVNSPQPNEKGTISVTTVDQSTFFPTLASGLYAQVQNELSTANYWNNQEIPANPQKKIESGLKGANLHKSVDAIPSSVRFKYDETTTGGRAVDITTSTGFGQPTSSTNKQAILNELGKYVNNLVPDGTAIPNLGGFFK